MCAQVPKTLSFGSAMLGAPAADHCYAPSQGLPDAWLLCFTEHHADAAVLGGLSGTCRGGRDLAVQAARKAALTLTCANLEPDAAWDRRLVRARHALSVRGKRPTSVRVVHQGGGGYYDTEFRVHRMPSQERLMSMLDLLHGVGQGVTELGIDVSEYTDHAGFLRELALACPNVASLQLGFSSLPTLPPASQWPGLVVLRLVGDFMETEVLRQIAPYIGQFTTLQLPFGDLHSLD